jgi:hypothetical protein
MELKGWRVVRRPLSLTLRRGWRWGNDPRRKGGTCLISPRGTVYEWRRGQARALTERWDLR